MTLTLACICRNEETTLPRMISSVKGIADEIVDITATGKTMIENDLVEMETVAQSTTRLIANEVSYRVKNETIENFINSLKKVIK